MSIRVHLPIPSFVTLVVASLCGCSVFTEPDPSRHEAEWAAEAIPDGFWPAREVEGLDEVAAAMPRRLYRMAGAEDDPTRIPVLRVTSVTPSGRGLVRSVRPLQPDGSLVAPERSPELQFVSYRPGEVPRADAVSDVVDQVAAGERFVSVEPDGSPRGVAVVITGEAGRGDAVDAVVDALVARGVLVLRTDVPRLVDRDVAVTIDDDDDLEAAARRIARAADERLAETAYAVEAVLPALERRRAALAGAPRAVLGFGLGAVAAPTVAARLDRRSAAVVLAGGGVNVAEIARSPGLDATGVSIAADPVFLGGERLAWFLDLYLAESRLDPHHTTRRLQGTPVLQIHARFDDVVPAWTGEKLHERLGGPALLRVQGDHDDLQDEVEDEADWIADWVVERLDAVVGP